MWLWLLMIRYRCTVSVLLWLLLARDTQAKLALIVAQIYPSVCLSARASVYGALYSSKFCSETSIGFFPKLVQGTYVHSIAHREPRRLPACLIIIIIISMVIVGVLFCCEFGTALDFFFWYLMLSWIICHVQDIDQFAACMHWATSLFDLTFAEPIRWAKVRSKYLLKPKSEVISLSESLSCKSMI